MRSKQLHLFTVALACLVFFSCKKETETITSEPVSDYFPLEVGKYITYHLDSTVFVNFGGLTEVHSYQEKHLVDAKITDALGRESYRILRFIRDMAGTQSWRAAGSYFVTPLDKQIEVVENNMRFVKLHQPIRKDFTWKGNIYLPNKPFPSFSFTNDEGMKNWDYQYESVNDTIQYGQQQIPGVLRVLHYDEPNKLDTIDVSANQAFISKDAETVWLRGSANDTIKINMVAPGPGNEYVTIYNRTNFYASLNGIAIPPGFSLVFQFYNNKWNYPNPIFVSDKNEAKLDPGAIVTYVFGTATDTVEIDTRQLDTSRVKSIKVYNKTNFDAICKFNAATSTVTIPPGFGRSYELNNREWRIVGDANTLLDKDPYSSDLPFGSTTSSFEKYAKGIGLVYQELLLWEYQPPNGSHPNGFRNGFGVRRSIIDHN